MDFRSAPIIRGLCVASIALLVGCQTARRVGDVAVPEDSALLAVEVRFPGMLPPSLVDAYFVRGPIHGGVARLPEPMQATFVKDSRAYLLDPEPGTWSLVAVSYAHAPPRRREPVAGVFDTVASEGDIGRLLVLSAPLIERARTPIAPGRFGFLGVLVLHEGERVNADTRFRDVLQERLAEALRPGVTTRSGLAGRFSVTFTADPERSSVARGEAAVASFLRTAPFELGASPWADFLPAPVAPAELEPEPEPAPVAPPEPAPAPVARTEPMPEPMPEPEALPEPEVVAVPEPVTEEPAPVPEPEMPEMPEPEPAPETAADPAPVVREATVRSRQEGGPLPEIARGMSHDRVRAILGEPDARETFITPRALIPFYSGPGSHERIWSYRGRGRVVFDLNSRTGALRVLRVEPPDPAE